MQNLKRLLHGAYMTVALYYIIYKVSLFLFCNFSEWLVATLSLVALAQCHVSDWSCNED